MLFPFKTGSYFLIIHNKKLETNLIYSTLDHFSKQIRANSEAYLETTSNYDLTTR